MKRVAYANGGLDRIDLAILRELSGNARMPLRELAERIGLSAPSTAERLRRLEESGVIEGYTVRIDAAAIGLPVAVLIRLRPLPGELARVAEMLAATPQITECVRVTGDDCFVAKAMLASVTDLEALIDGFLPHAATNTALIHASPVKPRLPAAPIGTGTGDDVPQRAAGARGQTRRSAERG